MIDEREFRATMKIVMRPMARCLRRFGAYPEELEDAIQIVLARIAGHWDRLDLADERSVVAYACTTAMHVAFDLRTARINRSSIPFAEDYVCEIREPLLSYGVEANVERRDSIAIVDAILETMPIEEREVFVLHEIEGFTSREIAAMLAMPAGTVASRLRIARAQFETRVRLRPEMAGRVLAEVLP